MNDRPIEIRGDRSFMRVKYKKGDFFLSWLSYMTPYHGLTPSEIKVAAAFLQERYNLSKVILNSDLVDETLMNEKHQDIVRGMIGTNMKKDHFQVMKSKLRAKNFITEDNRINSLLIPKITDDNGRFLLIAVFDPVDK